MSGPRSTYPASECVPGCEIATHCLRRRFVKFQGVSKLSIFIEDNQGEAETTRVQKIALFGSAGETMDVKAIKKVGEEEDKG